MGLLCQSSSPGAQSTAQCPSPSQFHSSPFRGGVRASLAVWLSGCPLHGEPRWHWGHDPALPQHNPRGQGCLFWSRLVLKSAGTERSRLGALQTLCSQSYDSLTIPLFPFSELLVQVPAAAQAHIQGMVIGVCAFLGSLSSHLLTQDLPTLLPTRPPPHFPHTIPFSSQLILFL